MSRIIRSLDLQKPRITEVDLQQQAMGSQHPDRPAGGFHGFIPGKTQGEVLSHVERCEREAEQLREEARRQVEEAQRQAEAIQADAYRQGFEQGERAGEKLALQKAEPVVNEFEELIRAIQADRDALIAQHEQELIRVAFAIATQVLKTTIELEPEVVGSVVEAALAKIGQAQEIKLKLSPYDAQMLEQTMRRHGHATWPPAHVQVEADETVGRGGCRVESESGDIDATIETQLRQLKNALWGE